MLAVFAASAWCPSAVQAQTLDDDFWISGMAFMPKVDTDARVSLIPSTNVGTDIDLESDLQLDDDEILPSFTAGARFGKVVVTADFYKLSRNGASQLERDIVFDGVTYPASARVSSGFDSDIYRLTVGYAFVQRPNLEIGAALGLHATRFDLSIEGEVEIADANAQTQARARDLLAPLPTVGLFATYKVAERLELNGRIDYLSLKIKPYDGKLINAQAGLNYRIMRHASIGMVYRYVYYRVGVEKDHWEGRIRYELNGPALVLQASF